MENRVRFSIFYCYCRNKKYKTIPSPIATINRARQTSIRPVIKELPTILIKAESRTHNTINASTAGKRKTATINKFMVYLVLKTFNKIIDEMAKCLLFWASMVFDVPHSLILPKI